MSIVYNWTIEQMDSYLKKDGNENVVFNCYWHVRAYNGNYSADSYGIVALKINNDSEFTPYHDLTEDIVVGWVKSELGEDQIKKIENELANQIKDLTEPPVSNLPLPW